MTRENPKAKAKARTGIRHSKVSLGHPEKDALKARANTTQGAPKEKELLKDLKAPNHFLRNDRILSCMELPLQAHLTTRTLKALLLLAHQQHPPFAVIFATNLDITKATAGNINH
jgi:hypothetical protein